MNFVTALEYGLPPTADWSNRVDIITMLLNDTINIMEATITRKNRDQDSKKSPLLRDLQKT